MKDFSLNQAGKIFGQNIFMWPIWVSYKYEREKNPSYLGYERYGDTANEEFWIERGYKPSYYNFYNDGLRWSTCCEFS